jgi:hypothetical protein
MTIRNINSAFGMSVNFDTVDEMATAIQASGYDLPEDGLKNGRDYEVVYTITLGFNSVEVNEFCKWLNDQGHDASIGDDDTTRIDGVDVTGDEDLAEISGQLWNAYCNN